MERTLYALASVLVLQLVLALLLWGDADGLAPQVSGAPLVDEQVVQADRLDMSAGKEQVLRLRKEGEQWHLPDFWNLPADADKVSSLLSDLKGLTRNGLVATSEAAGKRFKVAADQFERRLQVAAGERQLLDLYLGSSAGASRTRARLASESAIYEVSLGLYQMSAEARDWYDKTLLAVSRPDLRTIRGEGWQLIRSDPQGDSQDETPAPTWRLVRDGDVAASEGAGDEELQKKIDSLLDRLAVLRFDDVLSEDARADYGLDSPQLLLEIEVNDTQLQYQLGEYPEKEAFVLKSSAYPQYFRLPNYQGQPLLDAVRKLTGTEAVVAPPAEAEASAG
jgi:hypothetical protein